MKLLLCAGLVWLSAWPAAAQTGGLDFLNGDRPVLDAHNCYPYEGRWADRIERALNTGLPVAIEQDLAWVPGAGPEDGRVVVSHQAKTNGSEPDERRYFWERVRPLVEKQLAQGDSSKWPLIVVHFDFKDENPALLRAVWALLGEYEGWITTARKAADPHDLTRFERKPILVLTEDADEQERVFFDAVPPGSRLRVFGSAHTHRLTGVSAQEAIHLAATLPASQLLTEKPTTYRRWWNNSWYEVEEGGQPRAGSWTTADMRRLRELVDYAHGLGYWIRFYTLDGFERAEGKQNGWLAGYNFGSLAAARERWMAAIEARVDLIASDQYEELSKEMKGPDLPNRISEQLPTKK